MDILKIIEGQIAEMEVLESSSFLDQIFNHLQRAELYYRQGRSDDQYFNDVVYRTNQAFEGALKEAYQILGEKSEEETHKISPFNIEKYFRDNNVFKDRVLKLFENYRQNWRNISAHDYKLVLDENEAFLALINVSAFVHLLLKQIQEKVSYNRVIEKGSNEEVKRDVNSVIFREGGSLADKIASLIAIFAREEHIDESMRENQVNGMLTAFFKKYDEQLLVRVEPLISHDFRDVRPDMIISDGSEQLVLEIKRFRKLPDNSALSQVAAYLRLAKIDQGLIYGYANSDKQLPLKAERHELYIDGKPHVVTVLS